MDRHRELPSPREHCGVGQLRELETAAQIGQENEWGTGTSPQLNCHFS